MEECDEQLKKLKDIAYDAQYLKNLSDLRA